MMPKLLLVSTLAIVVSSSSDLAFGQDAVVEKSPGSRVSGTRAVLPLRFLVTTKTLSPADRRWIEAQVGAANRIFAPYGLGFRVREIVALGTTSARLESRRDRHRLAEHWAPGSIDCFVVERLRDVDDPSQWRRGVHWKNLALGRRYVILARDAPERVLAHELGHYLGNPRHSEVPGNLMSYQWTEADPVLDAKQAANARRSAEILLREGALLACCSGSSCPAVARCQARHQEQ